MSTDRTPTFDLPPRLKGLVDLAYDLRWSWDPETTLLWQELAERTGLAQPRGLERPRALNPVEVLRRLSPGRVREWLGDEALLGRVAECRSRLAAAQSGRAFGGRAFAEGRPIAYLSMEFAVETCLPFYAGGLGVLAGDHVKTASDIGLPLVALGLAYRRGYYRQEIDAAGKMKVVYPKVDYGRLPLEVARDRRGRPLRIVVELPGSPLRRVELRVWKMRTGNCPIFLLDSDHPGNPARDRALCRFLYGGTREDRIAQEVLLGVGSVRVLAALGIEPAVWHLNEGHVTFSTLERIARLRAGVGSPSFAAAAERVASNTVFTTHTPVPEGNEVFELALARRYLEPHCQRARIDVDEYLELGVDRVAGGRPVLSMTVLAIRLSRRRNGVSALHGQVSRRMWRHLWPGVAEEDVPITSVTNGVHVPTWISRDMSEVFTTRLAADWRARLGDSEFWKGALRLPDRLLWKTRGALRARLVDFVRARVASQLERTGSSAATIRRTTVGLFDPEVFTIGFARRFALYKRAALLFRDAATARDLFESKRRPLQIVFAGKPHPEDPQGKRLFEEVVAISRRRPFRGRVVVIENYDMDVGRALVQGVDLWLNNPRRPLEASGTSGQKVPFNGGLNLSVLDGWWDEGYEPDAGWAIGERREYHDPGTQDAEDAASLYRVLTREVVPLFYARDRQGVPHEWLRRVKRSMATHIPRFSTVAMLGNYVRKLYEPAAESGRRLESRPALARDLVEAREQVRRCWPMVHQTAVRERRSRKQVRVGVEFFVAGLGEDQLEVRAQLNGSEDLAPVEVVRTRDAALEFQFDLPARARGPLRVTLWPRHAAGLLAETGLSCEVAW